MTVFGLNLLLTHRWKFHAQPRTVMKYNNDWAHFDTCRRVPRRFHAFGLLFSFFHPRAYKSLRRRARKFLILVCSMFTLIECHAISMRLLFPLLLLSKRFSYFTFYAWALHIQSMPKYFSLLCIIRHTNKKWNRLTSNIKHQTTYTSRCKVQLFSVIVCMSMSQH